MLKFYRERVRVVVDPMSLTIEPLLKIWMGDKTELKEAAIKHLTYIHLVSQIDSDAPFSKVDPMDVGKLVKRELWGDFNYTIFFDGIDGLSGSSEDLIDNMILQYQAAFETPEEASVRSYDRKIYEIRNLIDSTVIEIKPSTSKGVTTYVTNFTIINKMMQDLTKIVKVRDELKAMILKQTTRDSMKGKQKLSFHDKRRRELREASAGITKEAEDPDEPTDL